MRLLFLSLLFWSATSYAKVVEYELVIDYEQVNITGKPALAMLVNKQYPAPTLEFVEGDVAKITVINNMDVDTSIHWHGLLVPAKEDGVPYLSNFPIKPHGSYTYQFTLKHGGTYWYHSHTDLQEQLGVHGGIIVKSKNVEKNFKHEALLVLQDWTDENPKDVLANLKKDGDHYALKKDSVVSMWGYWQAGAMHNWLDGRWMRMGGMDVSDVAYDAFLINGKKEQSLFPDAKSGEKVKLRIVNSGTSTYFYLHAAKGLDVEVIAADGNDVQPFKLSEILHAPAETYDLLITIPEKGSYELRASSQDGTGFASVFLGSGEKYFADTKKKPNLYVSHNMHETNDQADSDVSAHAMHAGMNHGMGHEMNKGMKHEMVKVWSYQQLKSIKPSTLPEGEVRDVELRLTGTMDGYNWSFNDVPLSKADKIKINKGEVVRFHFKNETMMHHPLHLHGHFFRVLTGNGEYDPLKHTVNVAPMENVTIEFFANEEKDWFFHCHNLYHAKTGMARVVSYRKDDMEDDVMAMMRAKKLSKDIKDSDFYYKGSAKILNDFGSLNASYFNYQHAFMLDVDSYDYEFDQVALSYAFKQSAWFNYLASMESNELEDEFKIGFSYVLPLMIDANFFINDEGNFELELETELQLTKRVQSHLEYSTAEQYHYALEYRFNERLSAELAYTNAVETSAGVKVRF